MSRLISAMDSLAAYQEDSEDELTHVVATAPPVTTQRMLVAWGKAMDGDKHEIRVNPTYRELWAPVQGPIHDYQQSGLVGNVPKNIPTGFVEEHALDHSVFDQQLLALHRQQPNQEEADLTRSKRGDPSDVSSFKGPWASFLGEDFEREDEFEQDSGGFVKSVPVSIAAEDGEQSEKKAKTSHETSEFHGEELFDYQGRSYVHPPSHLRPRPHKCYVPKKHLHTYSGHTKAVNAIRFFPAYGHLLLSASMDSKVKLWDVYNQQRCIRTFSGHEAAVRDICFTNDGKQFLSVSYDSFIKLWDTETGECIQRFSSGKIPYCAKFHPDRQHQFLVGQNNRRIVQYDLRSGKVVMQYNEHLGAVNTITFVDNNRKFVSTSDDKKMMIWEYGTPVVIKHVTDPQMHSMPATALHPTEAWFACQSLSNEVLVYSSLDKCKANRKKRFVGHDCAGFAAGICFSADGSMIVSGDALGRCFIWDWKKETVLWNHKVHDKVTIDVQWHPIEPSRLATCSWDGTIKLWD